MDKEIRRYIILGLFVTLGLIIFIFGIFKVGSKNEMFTKTFLIKTVFTNTNGLKAGGNVRFNGVNVGAVKAVTLLNDSLVEVDMQIEETKHQFITRSAIASIASDGLMGDKLINISNSAAGSIAVQPNDYIQSRGSINTDKVLQTLNESNDNVKAITANLKTITTDLNTRKGSLQALYKDTVMAASLKRSFSNLKNASNEVLQTGTALKQIALQIQTGKGTVGQILHDTAIGQNLASTVNKLKAASDKLNSVSGQMEQTMQHINSGSGAVNKLLTDTALSADLKQSITNIKQASVGLNEDLEGLKHSVLLRGYFKKKAKEQKRLKKE